MHNKNKAAWVTVDMYKKNKTALHAEYLKQVRAATTFISCALMGLLRLRDFELVAERYGIVSAERYEELLSATHKVMNTLKALHDELDTVREDLPDEKH